MVLNKLWLKRQSIVFTWMLSYCVLLVIPIVFSAFTYIITAKVLENEINSTNTLLLKKIQQGMDALLYDAEKLSSEVAFNPQVNKLLKAQESQGAWDSYDIYTAVNDLNMYRLPNNSIDDYYIYFNTADIVLSGHGSYDSRSFYEIYMSGQDITYDQWFELVAGDYKGEYRTLPNQNSRGSSSKTIMFIQTIPFLERSDSPANIIISLDNSRFLEDAGDIRLLNKGTVAILDESSSVIVSSGASNGPLKTLKYEDLDKKEGIVHGKLNNEKVVISYITSQIAGWKYITVIPESVFWEKADYVRKLTISSLLVCFVVCGGITYMLLRRNYNPVGKLVKLLEGYHGMNYDKGHNEYSFIEQAIDKAYTDKAAIDRILKQQNKVLRADFLARLIKGRESWKEPVKDKLLMYDIALKSDCFAVMAFYIEKVCGILPGEEQENSEAAAYESFKMTQFLITNVVEELAGQRNQGFVTDVDDVVVCIVNFEEAGMEEAKSEMFRIAGEARSFLKEHYDIRFMAAISNVHRTLAGIPQAYSEALQAMEYIKLLGMEQVMHFEDITGLPKGNYYYPLEKELQFINHIKVGEFDNSKMILDEIFQRNFESSILSVEIARCLMFNLVSTMIKTINEINYEGSNYFPESEGNNDFLEGLNPVDRLLDCKNINEMKNEMVKILKIFCEYIKSRSKSKSRVFELEIKEKVIQFVQNNYYDSNIGIATIADRFNVNAVYLSRAFKEQTGEGLLDYINRIRLNKAKQLFKEQRTNLDSIAKAVGYSNTRTFTRTFKKYEGVTPGKFKDLG